MLRVSDNSGLSTEYDIYTSLPKAQRRKKEHKSQKVDRTIEYPLDNDAAMQPLHAAVVLICTGMYQTSSVKS